MPEREEDASGGGAAGVVQVDAELQPFSDPRHDEAIRGDLTEVAEVAIGGQEAT